MPYYQIQAVLSGNRTKTIINKDEKSTLIDFVIPFVSRKSIETTWGKKKNTYQVLEMRIFKTNEPWDKKTGKKFEEFTQRSKNLFTYFERKAKKSLLIERHPVFIIMPIQGDKFGTQDDQRIFKEYDERFKKIEDLLQSYNCTAIRIDKEYPIEELVKRIKAEIENSKFIIADLTDERPSCYYEAGFADAKGKHIIFVASKESVINPKEATRIHFDIHKNVAYFSNHDEMIEKIRNTVEKNKSLLFKKEGEPVILPG